MNLRTFLDHLFPGANPFVGGSTDITEAPLSLAPFFLLKGSFAGQHPIVAVFPGNGPLDEAEACLRAVSPKDLHIRSFPDWGGRNSYEESPPAIVGRRMECLLSLGTFDILLTTLAGLSEFLGIREGPEKAAINLRVGDEIPLEGVPARLLSLGFRLEKLVERPGDFARRGCILDVFPAHRENPLRLEFFGDTIESIREFNPMDQKSIGEIPECRILPAFYFHRPENIPPAHLSRLKARLNGEQLEKLSEMERLGGLHQARLLHQKIYPNGSLLQLLEGGRELRFFWFHPPEVGENLADLEHHDRSFFERFRDHLILPEPDKIRLDYDGCAKIFKKNNNYCFFRYQRGDWEQGIESPTSTVAGNFPLPTEFHGNLAVFRTHLRQRLNRERQWIAVGDSEVFADLARDLAKEGIPCEEGLTGPDKVGLLRWPLSRGVKWDDLTLYSVRELFPGEKFHLPIKRRKGVGREGSIDFLLDLKTGDFLVHVDHGVGIYRGTRILTINKRDGEFLEIAYKGEDRLFVPVHQVDRIQKFVGSQEAPPAINALNSPAWSRKLKGSREEVEAMARQLLAIYSLRAATPGFAFAPDSILQHAMEAQFPFDETPGQLNAIGEVKGDMETGTPMDRLICGDVGYGKTEVAIRAAFKAVQDSKQVAVICPTTLLSRQHFQTFSERLAGFPVNLSLFNRFTLAKSRTEFLEGIKSGKIDIAIGTHRLLHPKINWKNLGLLVVDEEQKFGVKHKETLKSLKPTLDVLTLTATPIPRTLNMALSGIRSLSIIDTPPQDRLPIKTFVLHYSDNLLRKVVEDELSRGGQVYYLFNRVQKIEKKREELQKLLPGVRIVIGHGQMDGKSLERVMEGFVGRKSDILLCTTIIESGLDIPNVNTLIVDGAEKLGLSQLYQIRGRIGRSHRQAHAYLFYNPAGVTEQGRMRLAAIEENSSLGSGYRIAMEDLEIRGAGNLLGEDQSGTINRIGFFLYTELLNQEIQKLKNPENPLVPLPEIKWALPAFFPDDYVPTEAEKLHLYQRLARSRRHDEIQELAEETRDRFGPPPASAQLLFRLMRTRLRAMELNISLIKAEGQDVALHFRDFSRVHNGSPVELTKKFGQRVFFSPTFPHGFFLKGIAPVDPNEALGFLEVLFRFLGAEV